ncbi:unnamed protein product [Orchesella dallaii]|uniref:Uncharacterized protein n=1 Tax=Orchesella dallaii TaxID=48710 RepID=A0ABP1Q7F7_9HEXA
MSNRWLVVLVLVMGVICSVNVANKEHDDFIRQDYANTLPHIIAMSLMAGSEDDSTKRKSYTSSDGSKLYIINEINPFVNSRSDAIQFIEIKASPPPGARRFKAKLMQIVLTAYSLKMVLVLFNLVDRQIPENGLFVLTSQEQGDKKVHIAGAFEMES